MGDGSEYEAFGDDLDAAIDALLAYELGPVDCMEWMRGGLQTATFPGHNYISLYWGDRESNFAHDLDKQERATVLRKLAESKD